MDERYLEDLKAGDRFRSAAHVVTQEQIVAFARDFDPQSFHLDDAAAKASLFQGLAASGWHTAAITMRLMTTGELRLAGGSIGLGIDELRWPLPVRPGDTLSVASEVLEARPSRSRPTHGVARIRHTTSNQRGDVVQTFVAAQLVRRRP